MRVVLHDRIDADSLPGGDTVQIRAIADFLTQRGHDVLRTTELAPDLSGVDVALLFNLTRPCDCFCRARNAMRQNVPYVVFPIYWDLAAAIPRSAHPYTIREAVKRAIPLRWKQAGQSLRFMALNGPMLKGRVRKRLRWRIATSPHRKLADDVIRHASAVCPNSRAEADHMTRQLGSMAHSRVEVILNGLYRDVATPTVRPDLLELPQGPFLLCAATIAPRKNQLNLALAAAKCDVPLLLAGKPGAGWEHYVERVKRVAGGRVILLGFLPYAQLRWLYERAQAHVLPSYIETPGLSSLEAAAAGCHIVVGAVEPVREYFGDRAIYCEPGSVDSIAEAIQGALSRPRPGKALADFVLETYSMGRVLAPLDRLLEDVTRKA